MIIIFIGYLIVFIGGIKDIILNFSLFNIIVNLITFGLWIALSSIIFIFRKRAFKDINDIFTVTKIGKNRTITQMMNNKTYFHYALRNNFKNNRLSNELFSQLNDCTKLSYEEINKFKGEILFVTTNDTMYNRLKKLEESKYIKLEVIQDAIETTQRFAKIDLVGLVTVLCNIFNKKFWQYINKKVLVGKYKITIL